MLIMPQKKKITTIFAERLFNGDDKNADFVQRMGEESEPVSKQAPTSTLSAEDAAMNSFLRAMDRKDAKGMASALKDFMYLCEQNEESCGLED